MEKYGEIPPRFTKAWWEYFWDYYKVHTIVGIGAVIAVIFTVVQCTNQEKYDLQMIYINPIMLYQDASDKLTEKTAEVLDDVDGDGKKLATIMELPITFAKDDKFDDKDKFNIDLMTKLDLELQLGEYALFVVSDEIAEDMKIKPAYYGYMQDIAELGVNIPEERLLRDENGRAFAVDITGNNLLKDVGLETNKSYLMVRRLINGEENDEKLAALHKNAVNAAKLILTQG